MKVFVDTNILLDVLLERQPFYQASANIWTLAESGRIEGCISSLSFSNVFYVVRKLAGREKARRALRLLRDVFTPVPPTNQVLFQAIDAGVDDFEDALQFHSALWSGCTCLVSRDPEGFPRGHLPVLSPKEFLMQHATGDAAG